MENLIKNDISYTMRSTSDQDHIINQRNINGITALYAAARSGNINVVKFLLEMNADPFRTSLVNIVLA